jgi:hypothetical protein
MNRPPIRGAAPLHVALSTLSQVVVIAADAQQVLEDLEQLEGRVLLERMEEILRRVVALSQVEGAAAGEVDGPEKADGKGDLAGFLDLARDSGDHPKKEPDDAHEERDRDSGHVDELGRARANRQVMASACKVKHGGDACMCTCEACLGGSHLLCEARP